MANDGRSKLSLTSRSLLAGRPKLSNGRSQAGSIFIPQEGHHSFSALPPDLRDQKAPQPVLRCVASIEGFVGQQLRCLCGSKPTFDEGGGAHLPFLIEGPRLAIEDRKSTRL